MEVLLPVRGTLDVEGSCGLMGGVCVCVCVCVRAFMSSWTVGMG